MPNALQIASVRLCKFQFRLLVLTKNERFTSCGVTSIVLVWLVDCDTFTSLWTLEVTLAVFWGVFFFAALALFLTSIACCCPGLTCSVSVAQHTCGYFQFQDISNCCIGYDQSFCNWFRSIFILSFFFKLRKWPFLPHTGRQPSNKFCLPRWKPRLAPRVDIQSPFHVETIDRSAMAINTFQKLHKLPPWTHWIPSELHTLLSGAVHTTLLLLLSRHENKRHTPLPIQTEHKHEMYPNHMAPGCLLQMPSEFPCGLHITLGPIQPGSLQRVLLNFDIRLVTW